jgi:hypothetical protein
VVKGLKHTLVSLVAIGEQDLSALLCGLCAFCILVGSAALNSALGQHMGVLRHQLVRVGALRIIQGTAAAFDNAVVCCGDVRVCSWLFSYADCGAG